MEGLWHVHTLTQTVDNEPIYLAGSLALKGGCSAALVHGGGGGAAATAARRRRRQQQQQQQQQQQLQQQQAAAAHWGDDVLVLWMMSHAGAKRCGWCHDVSDVHQALARLIL
jgi:hypothetical protein